MACVIAVALQLLALVLQLLALVDDNNFMQVVAASDVYVMQV